MKRFWVFLLTAALAFTACSAGGQEPKEPSALEKTVLIYATTNPEGIDRENILRFNDSHTGISIEVKDYSQTSSMGKTGWNRLVTDMITGNSPDIIDLGDDLPYRQMALRGYLEDLWPYIENDPDLGREGVMEAPLKAAEVDGKLYTVFESVCINTLVGPERIIGNRTSWSLTDLQSAFAKMPDGAVILEPFYTKEAIFNVIFSMNIDSYVDWSTGQCDFDSRKFRTALEFVNSRPADFDWSDVAAANEGMCQHMEGGLQMLSCPLVANFDSIRLYDKLYDIIFGGGASCVGFPVEDGSVGSSFAISDTRLAMSSTCKDKQAGWEFLRWLLLPLEQRYSSAEEPYVENWAEHVGFPINSGDFLKLKAAAMEDREGELTAYNNFGSISFELLPLAETEYEKFMSFYNSIEKTDLCDRTVYNIVLDSCGPYFAGDKTLDETIGQIQNRVGLYVNEQK